MRLQNPSVSTALVPVAALLFACAPNPSEPSGNMDSNDSKPPPFAQLSTGCSGNHPGGEGEIIGSLYEDEDCVTSTTVGITLTPDATTLGRINNWFSGETFTYDSELQSDTRYLRHWHWWDPDDATGPCGPTLVLEVDHDPDYDERNEGHCIRPGRYTWVEDGGLDRTFPVDYLQGGTSTEVDMSDGDDEYLERESYTTGTATVLDLFVHIDTDESQSQTQTPSLEIDNAGASPSLPFTFVADASPSGYPGDWFFFRTSKSVSGWDGANKGKGLVRLFYHNTAEDATGYFDPVGSGPVTRRYRYTVNPTTSSQVYTVGMDYMLPYELPVSAVGTKQLSRTITILRRNPDLEATSVGPPSSLTAGSAATATIDFENLSSNAYADVEAGWSWKLYLSTDDVLSTGTDTQLASGTHLSVLQNGGSDDLVADFTMPSGISGVRYLIAHLDSGDQIIEAGNDDNNKKASSSFTVVLTPPAPAPPEDFELGSVCEEFPYNGRWYAEYGVTWDTSATVAATDSFRIYEGGGSSPWSTASVTAKGRADALAGTIGDHNLNTYLVRIGSTPVGNDWRHFWLEFFNSGGTSDTLRVLGDSVLVSTGCEA